MPPARSTLPYKAELDLWQRALEAVNGLAIDCQDAASAQRLRLRLLHARRAQARLHADIYPQDSPFHAKSFYEDLLTRIDKANPKRVQILHNTPSYEVLEL